MFADYEILREQVFLRGTENGQPEMNSKKMIKKRLEILQFFIIPENFRKIYPPISEIFCRQKGGG